jgi:tyrosinase
MYGRHGLLCAQKKAVVRRNFLKMSKFEQGRIIAAVTSLKHRFTWNQQPFYHSFGDAKVLSSLSDYDFLAWMHHVATQYTTASKLGFELDYAHEGPGFLPWHRHYLLMFEELLQSALGDSSIGLPYWDWLDPASRDQMFGLFGGMGGVAAGVTNASLDSACSATTPTTSACNVLDGVFSKWGVLAYDGSSNYHVRRCLNCSPSVDGMPDMQELVYALSLSSYDSWPYNGSNTLASFRNTLEGFHTREGRHDKSLHNKLHIFVGGTMGNVPIATADPIFWFHHAFVDSLYERWLRKSPQNTKEHIPRSGAKCGHNAGDWLMPFFPLVTNSDLSGLSSEYGYEYDYIDQNGNDDPAAAGKAGGTSNDAHAHSCSTTQGMGAGIGIGIAIGLVIALLGIVAIRKWRAPFETTGEMTSTEHSAPPSQAANATPIHKRQNDVQEV